jgi:hypothetical protein
MLEAPLTVLSIRYPPVVYVSRPSHSFTHKVSMLKTVRGAANINYWWIPYA